MEITNAQEMKDPILAEEYNIHTAWVMYVIKQTNAHVLFEFVDLYMRDLPFLYQSLLSTLFISIVPIFLIYFINMCFLGSKRFTNVLLSFSLGGLLGDVFFHTLPHLTGDGHGHGHGVPTPPPVHDSHDHGHGHSHGGHGDAGNDSGHAHNIDDMKTNLIIVVGIMAFFLLEQLTNHYFSSGDGHGHSHGAVEDKKSAKGKKKTQTEEELAEEAKQLRYKSFAVISMLGDFIHNFTDGLSIGVSYVADFRMGLVTTAAMFFHEIPHEVGDFAILFQLKYSLLQIVGV